MARALGMEVASFDPVAPAELFAKAEVHRCDLDELFERSNAVTIHVPLIESTRNLVSDRLLRLMPHGSVLINLSRGEVVDIAAVLRALDDGQLLAASVDVLSVEPPTGEHPAPVHEHLVTTPHAAWYSEQSADILFHEPLRVVRDLLSGKKIPDPLR